MMKHVIIYCLNVVFILLFSFSMFGQNIEKENGFVQIFYPNGQVSSEGTMRDGKPDGMWKTYYVTGVIKSEGKRTNFLLDSIWNFYNQAGELVQSISYQIGKKSGYSMTYIYDNPENPGRPTLFSKELYINDVKEGESYYYYRTGELQQIVMYRKGKKNGIAKEFSRDSTLISLMEYTNNYLINRERINREDDSGRRQGTFRTYFENGQIYKEQNFLDDELHGYYREYNRKGDLIIAMRYERGKVVEKIDEDIREVLDMKYTYDEEGRLIFSGGYRENIPVGIHRFYDTMGNVENAFLYNESGQKISEGVIDDQGRRKGSWKDFYPSGELRASGSYLNNLRSGQWTFYFLKGGVEQKGRFTRGRYDGSWIWYYPNGNVWREESYFNGKEDGMFTEYDITGKILAKGDYINGEREGEWTYITGDHREKGNYVIGLREGEWRYYYGDGTLKYEGFYSQGNPDGRHKYYYPSGELKEEQYYQMGIRERNWKKYNEMGELEMTITYRNNIEIRINGTKVNLPEDIKLIR